MSEHGLQDACGLRPAQERWLAVIDPDAASRAALRTLLSGLGAEVRTYAAAEPFLADLSKTLPLCLVTEVQLPAMSGLMLLQHLKSLRKGVPSILLASEPAVPLAVEIIREGVLDFVEKPLVDDRVARRVSALLQL
jgi:two-component system response regulator FixJ